MTSTSPLDRAVKIGPIVLPRWIVGADAHDAADLALYDFVWNDEVPNGDDFNALMRAAIEALDYWIAWNGDAGPD